MTWEEWFCAHELGLRTHRGLLVPRELPHPAIAGFRRLGLAEPWGQVADWACSLTDGGRLHVHEMKDGSLVAHIDRHDPARGTVVAAYHWGTESASGRTTLFTACLYVLIRVAPWHP